MTQFDRRHFFRKITGQYQASVITPSAEFFTQSYSRYRPDWTLDSWRLQIDGLIEEREINLSWADIEHLPEIERTFTLECSGNPVGGKMIGNARWKGVLFSDILKDVTLKTHITRARLIGWDGYQTAMDLRWILHPDTLLAYEMNGEPLSLEHGFPLRILIPGLYAQKMPKWLQRIEFIGYDFKGYWETRGWSDSATIIPRAAITSFANRLRVNEPLDLRGVAVGGLREITRVEIRIDGGAWIPTMLLDDHAPHSWKRWQLEWIPHTPGSYAIEVRVTDSSGFVQNSGLHKVIVQVV